MTAERNTYDVMMRAIKEERVPDGYYGPETMRWATDADRKELGLSDFPLVHLDRDGNIDCYFNEDQAVVVRKQA